MSVESEAVYPSNFIVFVTIYLLVIVVTGVIGNLLVILIFLKNKTINDQAFNIFTVNMAILDILSSLNLILVIHSLANGNQWAFGFVACQIQGSTAITVIIASVFNILAISIHRYIKLCRILRFNWMISQRSIKITVALVWILPIPFSTVNMVGGYWYTSDRMTGICSVPMENSPITIPIFLMVLYACIICGLSFSYYKIFKTLLSAAKAKVNRANKRKTKRDQCYYS